MIYYINNIPSDLADKVEKHIISPEIYWNYKTFTILPEHVSEDNAVSDDFVVRDHPIMHSVMYWQHTTVDWCGVVSELSNYLIDYFANNIVYEKLILGRIMANMTFPTKTAVGTIQQPHTDCIRGDPYYSFLYYPITCDGDTYFFESEKTKKNNLIAKASPIKGTGVFYNSDMVHAGSLPVLSDKRIAINFMFERTLSY